MNSPTPHHLTFRQRLTLRGWQTAVAAMTAVARRRAPDPPASVTEHKYGDHPDARLDVIAPDPDAEPKTAVVFIHGGGWVIGKKEMYAQPLYELAAAGHPVFNVEYPLAPDNPHPEILNSLLEALTWIKTSYPETESVHLIGDSAGGNLAMMLGIILTNPATAADLGFASWTETPKPASISSLYGVLDRLLWLDAGFPSAELFLQAYAGPEAFGVEVEASCAVTPMDLDFESLPPTFIAAAGKDKLASSSLLAYETFGSDHDVEYKLYEGAAHGFYTQGKQMKVLQADVADFIGRNS
ncbi:MAG: alpha/beta hydrolase [Actinobacteria bacterium]|nr:alpha/beta hydrolase [Actinomycetota bacterium]